MAMSVKTSAGGDGDMPPVAEINVTPLVDVMLVLLIIFMVTMPIMMAQLPITLPKASLVQTNEPPKKLQVEIDKAYNYFLQVNEGPKEAVAYTELPGRLHNLAVDNPDELVTVCADPDTIYDRVVDLMSMVGTAGFYKVAICP